MALLFFNDLPLIHQGESNPPGLSKWCILQLPQFLKCENKAKGLPVEVYTRVRVACMSSPSRAFHEPAHLSYENNI